jgi:hypothetical protein
MRESIASEQTRKSDHERQASQGVRNKEMRVAIAAAAGSLGLGLGKATQESWKCVDKLMVSVRYSNTSAPFAVGDCIVFTDPTVLGNITSDLDITLRIPQSAGFPNGTFGNFHADPSCSGLRLQSTHVANQSPSSSEPAISCATDQVAVMTTSSTPESKCTRKYGDGDHPWEKDGLLCYPKCRENFHGVGPVCWAECPADVHDGGVFCSRHTYQPHVRAIWPWNHCHSGEFKYGLECISSCKDGYSRQLALATYYCAQDCPANTINAGLTCTKKSYGRGAGKLAVPDWEFALIIAGSVVAAQLAVAACVVAPELIPEAAGLAFFDTGGAFDMMLFRSGMLQVFVLFGY